MFDMFGTGPLIYCMNYTRSVVQRGYHTLSSNFRTRSTYLHVHFHTPCGRLNTLTAPEVVPRSTSLPGKIDLEDSFLKKEGGRKNALPAVYAGGATVIPLT